MARVIDAKEIQCFVKLFKLTAIILAGSVLLQVYIPTVFYAFASRWFFYSNQYDMLLHLGIGCHQYSGLFYEVSFSALVLSLGCIICFVECSINKSEWIKNSFFIAIMYYAVILTGKRSFMLIVPVLLMMFWLFNDYRNLDVMRVTAVFGFLLLLIWKSNAIFGLVSSVLTKGQGDTIQLSSREQYWRLALDMFTESRIWGKGINSFDIAFNRAGIKQVVLDFAGAHNSYIQLLAETGIIGALLYVAGIFSTVISGIKEIVFCYKHHKKNKMIYNSIAVLALLLIMMYGVTGNVLYQPQQVFMIFLFLGMILNLKRMDESDFMKKGKNKVVLT